MPSLLLGRAGQLQRLEFLSDAQHSMDQGFLASTLLPFGVRCFFLRSVYCRMFSSILGLHPLDASSTSTREPSSSCDNQNTSRYCQMSPGRHIFLWLRSTGAEERRWGPSGVMPEEDGTSEFGVQLNWVMPGKSQNPCLSFLISKTGSKRRADQGSVEIR